MFKVFVTIFSHLNDYSNVYNQIYLNIDVQTLDYSTTDRNVWGPHYWYVFHHMANRYPKTPSSSDKETFKLTFNNMVRYLPCEDDCQKHTNEFVQKNPISLDSRDSLSKWMCELHNDSRARNGKEPYDCNSILHSKTDNCPNCSSNHQRNGSDKTIQDSTEVIDHPDDIAEDPAVRNTDIGPQPDDAAGQKSGNASGKSEPGSSTMTKGIDPVSRAIVKSKEAKKDLFLALCKQYKVKPPSDFKFEPCRTNAQTSCIDYKLDPKDPVPYINPYTDSDRQVIHEFEHYRAYLQEGKISDEQTAEKFAYEKISRAYPMQEFAKVEQLEVAPEPSPQSPLNTPIEKSNLSESEAFMQPPSTVDLQEASTPTPIGQEGQPQIALIGQDSTNSTVANVGLIKSTQPKRKIKRTIDDTIQDIATNSAVSVGDIDTSLEGNTSEGYEQRFPNYARAVRESQMAKKDAELGKKLNEGFISYLDPIYKFPAKALGVQPGQLNLAHTPQIIMNVVQTLVESNTTPIGAGLFSFLVGISLFVTGYLGKASISFRDQLALQNISAAFVWRTMQYINPKYEMKKDLKKMYQRIQDGDFRLSDTFIETPGMWKKKMNKMKNAWTSMPHYLGKDEKGRPAFIIPAPVAFATMGMAPGAPLSGTGAGIGAEFSMPIHQGGNIGGLNLSAAEQKIDEPMYQLGSGYYDTGDDPYAYEQMGSMMPQMGSIGPINPDVLRSVSTVG